MVGSAPPSHPPLPPPPPPMPKVTYDHLEIVLTWPPTFCLKSVSACDEEKIGKRLGFYLHGCWPADKKGGTLTYCHGTQYDAELIRSTLENAGLVSQLEVHWPTLAKDKRDKDHWSHQWNKHGICSESRLDVLEYFKRGSEQAKKLVDLVWALTEAKITPSDTHSYTKATIEAAVQKLVGPGIHIYVSCWKDPNNSLLLHEIYVCLDVSARSYVSCPVNKATKGCDLGNAIKMPPFKFQDPQIDEHDEL
ncbi:ribonuclease 3-like [Actinidia eriantha]|uniref:ribonuclease 3-like n=1 Tax=Actinidia eriantha TaxID=165200 RepID=UPI002589FCF9|nr:ribonuclease 3-like [Actinidia eriantha]XP_057480040.1 ribonuclease 3-like [Actinidia eriantha]